jgi:hypothetical protein
MSVSLHKGKRKKKPCRTYKTFKSHLDLMTHHLRASVFLKAKRETFDSRIRKHRSRLQEQTSASYSLKEHDLVLPPEHLLSVAYKCTMHPFPRIGLTKFPNAQKQKGTMLVSITLYCSLWEWTDRLGMYVEFGILTLPFVLYRGLLDFCFFKYPVSCSADPDGHELYSVVLRLLDSWDRGFESR